jgi:tetratricopeptide (TPR) repeat protein
MPAARRQLRHWPLVAILVLAGLTYSNCFRGALVFDSAPIIGEDPRIREATAQNLDAIVHGRYWYVSSTAGLYRPLTTLTFLANYAVLGNGPRPEGYHWVNLALHEVNIALVYALGLLIFESAPASLALAAVWGVHPLLTEAVTNLVGRADLLAAFGVLAGLLCHIRSRRTGGKRSLLWLAGLVAAQAIGLFSKENAVVLPGLMLLYDLVWRDSSSWLRRAAAYAALILPFVAFFYLRAEAGGVMHILPAENPLVNAGFWTARLTAVKIIGSYLALFLWPIRLSADYSYNAVPFFTLGAEAADATAVLALAMGTAAAVVVAWMAVRRGRIGNAGFFFGAFFLITLAPTSNLILLIGSVKAERFLYLPAVGLAGFAVAAVSALLQKRWGRAFTSPIALPLALAVVCLPLAARTYSRNFDWRDDLTLWSSAVEVCPTAARPHYNLGNALSHIPGRAPDAIAQYRAALKIRPDDADAHVNLGNALANFPGTLPDAVTEFQAGLRLRPDNADAHDDLGNALANLPGRLPDAIAQYHAALRLRPDRAEFHYNLASALLREPGAISQAIAEYQTALQIHPDDADAHNNFGNALATIPGRLPDAIAEYQAALRLRPLDAQAHYNLANALAATPGRSTEAITEYQATLRLAPDSAEAHNNLGTVLAQTPGRLPEAVAQYQAAIRLKPDFSGAHVNLGNAYAEMPERLSDAIAEYEAAWRISGDPAIRQLITRLQHRSQNP